MGKPKRKNIESKEQEKSAPAPIVEKQKEGMTQKDAEKLASNYLPQEDKRYAKILKDGKEVQVDMYDIMYVTSDGNVFYKQNEGSAFNHAKQNNLKHFTVKF